LNAIGGSFAQRVDGISALLFPTTSTRAQTMTDTNWEQLNSEERSCRSSCFQIGRSECHQSRSSFPPCLLHEPGGFNELSLPIFNVFSSKLRTPAALHSKQFYRFFDLQARRIAGSAITSDFSKSQLCCFHLLAYENGRSLWEFDKPTKPMAGMHGSAIAAICISMYADVFLDP
jgi:hypothetical protein